MPEVSKVHLHRSGRDMRPVDFTAEDAAGYGHNSGAILAGLGLFGLHFSAQDIAEMAAFDAAPDLQPLVGTATLGAPIQFLQSWLPGWIRMMTSARKIDELIGMDTVGSWEDEEIIQGVLEPTGLAQLYGDYTNVPLSSYNPSFERRTIVRFEEGLQVGKLEEARMAKMGLASGAEKRAAAGLALEIQRNRLGFFGFNGGANRTYGYLNDPNEGAYVVVPNGAGGSPLWSLKTWKEITADLRLGFAKLRTQSASNINPGGANGTRITLAISSDRVDFLTTQSDFGLTVYDWLTKNYPNTRIVDAPEMNGVNGGASVFYMYADHMEDGSSDGGKVFRQLVPTKFRVVGVEARAKTYVEDYTNASAGAFLARPYALVRYSGI